MAELGSPVVLKNEDEFGSLVAANANFLTVASFIAQWSENCNDMKEVTRELANDAEFKKVLFVEIEAEEFPNVCKKYEVTSVPSIVFIRNQSVVDRLVGADVRKYAGRVSELESDGPSVEGVPVKTVPKTAAAAPSNESEPLENRLKRLINQANVMIFMKGNPGQPRCGFSRQVIELINATGVSYQTFDILEDEEVRQGLKTYSDWQTYPQIYVNGKLIGGLDVLRDLKDMGDLDGVLAGTDSSGVI